MSAASSFAGSVRYCTTSIVWLGRPASSQVTCTVTRRTDSCSPRRMGSMKLLIRPPIIPVSACIGSLDFEVSVDCCSASCFMSVGSSMRSMLLSQRKSG